MTHLEYPDTEPDLWLFSEGERDAGDVWEGRLHVQGQHHHHSAQHCQLLHSYIYIHPHSIMGEKNERIQ